MEVLDLDVLNPERRGVKLGGFEVDTTIIPLAITFKVNEIVTRMSKLDQSKLTEDNQEELGAALDLTIELCVVYCEHQHPEMTREWFMTNCDLGQINALGAEIQGALTRAYRGVPEKN